MREAGKSKAWSVGYKSKPDNKMPGRDGGGAHRPPKWLFAAGQVGKGTTGREDHPLPKPTERDSRQVHPPLPHPDSHLPKGRDLLQPGPKAGVGGCHAASTADGVYEVVEERSAPRRSSSLFDGAGQSRYDGPDLNGRHGELIGPESPDDLAAEERHADQARGRVDASEARISEAAAWVLRGRNRWVSREAVQPGGKTTAVESEGSDARRDALGEDSLQA